MAELRLKSTGTIKLFENDNTSSVTIASPASLGADRTITLPDASVTLASGTMLATDGSGASLTALNASELGSGTVPDARFPATLPAASGVNLTSLNASNLGSGTVPAARLSGVGKVLQVIQDVDDASHLTTTNTAAANAGTELSIAITPAAATSKFLLQWVTQAQVYDCTASDGIIISMDFQRVITGGATTDDLVKDSQPDNLQYRFNYDGRVSGTLPRYFHPCITQQYIDSPSTTSEVTYSCWYSKNDWEASTANAAGLYQDGIFIVMEIGA